MFSIGDLVVFRQDINEKDLQNHSMLGRTNLEVFKNREYVLLITEIFSDKSIIGVVDNPNGVFNLFTESPSFCSQTDWWFPAKFFESANKTRESLFGGD